ncbi:BAHD acyltransferase DCR-like [Cryptomeria japonica]|uniref:BAHD acyltransferase DCR-like n=1 Tax=Cryptomeria japonica TaxID=3369 RepID=UPI0027D9F68C|nr:BAHD acyltransferase DCR-like [Cryptomeria japonica]
MIRVNRKRTVSPATPSEPQQIKLLPLDLQMMFAQYIQQGLLYQIPGSNFSSQVDLLAETLSRMLVKFYPLARRLTTSPVDGGIYILCNDSDVDFIEAMAGELSIADLIVTQLKDGVSVCCTVNHAVADGTSFWNFFNSWAELCRTNETKISANPTYNRYLLDRDGSAVRLGLDPNGQIPRFCPPLLRVKMFHFSAHTIKRLKERANRDSPVTVSSFQALCGHLWQAVTRARGLGPDETATFQLSVNCRPRLIPPLPESYFGNAVQAIFVTSTAGELNRLPLSFPAGLLNSLIGGQRDGAIRESIGKWVKEPVVYKFEELVKNVLMVGSSPRFEIYENDFGWGGPVALRCGTNNHFDGMVSAFPSREGGGSVEFEICLLPPTMNALEIDQDFICPLH